jgi:ZIP family zinc transporter
LLAAVTLDGVPENLAMGVALTESGNATLLVAIFASNLPEATVGAQRMREAGLSPRQILTIWSATAVLLAVAVIVGFALLDDIPHQSLAWPLGFAGGAVLASLADTLMPEAYKEGGSWVALATAAGFLVSFLLSAG